MVLRLNKSWAISIETGRRIFGKGTWRRVLRRNRIYAFSGRNRKKSVNLLYYRFFCVCIIIKDNVFIVSNSNRDLSTVLKKNCF